MCFIHLVSEGYTSLQWLLLSQSTGSRHMGSVVVVCRPWGIGSVVTGHRLSSYGTQAFAKYHVESSQTRDLT